VIRDALLARSIIENTFLEGLDPIFRKFVDVWASRPFDRYKLDLMDHRWSTIRAI
jgi:hypothetical protein